MEKGPVHYDGSIQVDSAMNGEFLDSPQIEITDNIRKNIGQNPYSLNQNE